MSLKRLPRDFADCVEINKAERMSLYFQRQLNGVKYGELFNN